MRVGMWFYGLSTVATGILNIVWGEFESSHQPVNSLSQHIPGEHALAYFIGFWLVAAGLAILWRRATLMGAIGCALIYLIFALLWLPRYSAMTHQFGFHIGVVVFILGGIAQQFLLAAPAAIVYAAGGSPDPVWRERFAVTARLLLGLSPIAFGLEHLSITQAVARFVPHWIPFATFWTVLTGIAFLLAGSAIVSGIRDILAVRLLVLMLLLFEAAVEIPPVFLQPHKQVAWGGAIYNLTAIGAYWMFAEFVASRPQPERRRTGIAEPSIA